MRFCPRAVIAFLLLLLTASVSGAAEDWRLDSYDRAQALFRASDQKEAELLKQYEPRIAEFSALFYLFQDANRKMQRYVFLKKLRENPESINWTRTWDWADGRDIGTKEQEDLAAKDPAFRALREDFLAKKEALRRAKDLTKMRNSEYEKHAEIFYALEEKLLKDLEKLQAEVDQRMSNTPMEPSR